jgi:hypothetical protein
MRYADLALLLLPIVLLAAWFTGIRGLTPRAAAVALLVLAGLGATLALFGEYRGFTGHYEPAHLKDDRVVPAHRG